MIWPQSGQGYPQKVLGDILKSRRGYPQKRRGYPQRPATLSQLQRHTLTQSHSHTPNQWKLRAHSHRVHIDTMTQSHRESVISPKWVGGYPPKSPGNDTLNLSYCRGAAVTKYRLGFSAAARVSKARSFFNGAAPVSRRITH